MPRTKHADLRATNVQILDRVVQGFARSVPIREYLPERARPGAAPFLWIHGGGWSAGGLDQKESHSVAKAIAGSGRHVRTVDYRLVPALGIRALAARTAPELKPSDNRFPAALDDVEAVALDLARVGGGRLLLGGASAGANLAVTATVALRSESSVEVRGLALAYGGFHAVLPDVPGSVRASLTGIPGLIAFTPESYNRMTINYVGDPRYLPDAFPTGDDLVELPPSLVMDADRDTLRASGDRFAADLKSAGSEVDYVIVEKTLHGFLNQTRSKGFRRGIQIMTQWLDARD